MRDGINLLDPLFEMLPHLRSEGIIGLTILAVAITALFRKRAYPLPAIVGIGGLIASGISLAMQTVDFSDQWFVIDQASFFWRVFLDGCLTVILLFRTNRHLQKRSAEFVVLALTIVLGAHFLIISRHLFMVYLSVEVMSLSAYMLVALPLFRRQVNAAFKYLVFGAASSAIMLYGISLFYGLQGSLSLQDFQPEAPLWQSTPGWTVLLLIAIGLLFKIAAAPFHIWVNDVYRDTSLPVLAIFSVVPKLAALVFLIRWIPSIPDVEYLVALLSMFTLAVGNFGALRQEHVRGLLGLSAIAHTGFMLTGLLLLPGDFVFLEVYMAIYALMTIGSFHLLNHYELTYGVEKMSDLAGMSQVSVWKTIGIVVWMIALTGLPPTAGFTAKLLLFSGVAARYSADPQPVILYLLIFAVLNAVIALAYYLKIPYQMIFRKPEIHFKGTKNIWTLENFLGTILVLAILILFIKPEWLMGWINSVSFVP